MDAKISVITLAVADLARALTFYRDGLGLKTEGIVGEKYDNGACAFFHLAGGLVLALWPAKSMAAELDIEVSTHGSAVMIAHNVDSHAEVDRVMAQARAAGAQWLKAPSELFWGGYGGYFRDLDGHVWEVVYNPKGC
ncbi:glyoxalase [Idiomarina tyrosinivorans]|uniref:Glyoxalase n=1 Tax=Idiomarina tyrosinivorans TaxID=1445662 RepID=A0A432ZLP3_9GAMM|nr:VOC family protein [Idiomarina tyrosinivorans]RUO78917.1 glyoxalase [Idiomarina tyrosinivorans]